MEPPSLAPYVMPCSLSASSRAFLNSSAEDFVASSVARLAVYELVITSANSHQLLATARVPYALETIE